MNKNYEKTLACTENILTVDQRGLPRTVGAHPDLGAVELQTTEFFYNPVQSKADSGPWTLRAAIASVSSGSNITFVSNLSGQTISLTSGALLINENLTITGLGATNLAISGNNARQVFNIGGGTTVNISGLTIRNGQAGNGTNSFAANGPGGAGASGGGIFNSGALSLTNCALVSNSSGGGGAGFPPVNPTSGVTGTRGGAAGNGGAIFNQGTLRLSGCTVSGNVAGAGGLGGFGNFSTFVGGTGGLGGSGAGIYNTAAASATLFNCTFSGNSAGAGGDGGYAGLGQNNNPGGIDGDGGDGGSGANTNTPAQACDNTIIALNSAVSAPDVFGAFSSSGHNLIGKTDGSIGFGAASGILGTIAAPINPLLGPLQLNGGETATLALLPGSPAIETGDDSLAGADQRGFPRPNAAHVDIGAYELDISGFPPLSVAALGQTIGSQNSVTGDYSVTFSAAINPCGLITVGTVQYGLTTNYGGSSNLIFPSFGPTTLNLSNVVSVFAPGIVYHYRIVATNLSASVASPDIVFQTPAQYIPGDANGDGIVDQNEFNLVLSHYLATSPYLLITNPLGLGQSNVTFALSNANAGNYTVQYSTDLVTWQNLGPATPRYYFTDTNAPAAPQRYYRLAYPTNL